MKTSTEKKYNNYYSDKSLKLSSNRDTSFSIVCLSVLGEGPRATSMHTRALPLSHTLAPNANLKSDKISLYKLSMSLTTQSAEVDPGKQGPLYVAGRNTGI